MDEIGKKAKELWDNYKQLSPEEQKKARLTQWASAIQDAIREQEKRGG